MVERFVRRWFWVTIGTAMVAIVLAPDGVSALVDGARSASMLELVKAAQVWLLLAAIAVVGLSVAENWIAEFNDWLAKRRHERTSNARNAQV